MRELKIGARYRHFKNKEYVVEGTAKDSETGEILVLYRQCYGERELWARPLSMFLSEVDREKYPEIQQRYRFEEVAKQ